jgi:MFS family permease
MDIQHGSGGTYRTLVDGSPLSGLQWAVFVLCFLIMFLDGLDTVLIGFLAPYIGAEWKLAKGALTPVFTAGVVGLMIAGCMAGILADRVGRRPLLLAAVTVFGVANLATAYCASLEALVALRFVRGDAGLRIRTGAAARFRHHVDVLRLHAWRRRHRLAHPRHCSAAWLAGDVRRRGGAAAGFASMAILAASRIDRLPC